MWISFLSLGRGTNSALIIIKSSIQQKRPADGVDGERYESSDYLHIDLLLIFNCLVPVVLAIVQLVLEYRAETEFARSLVEHHNL